MTQMRSPGLALALALLTACGGGTSQPVTANNGGAAGASSQALQINGAGATFPNPIYSKWFSEYNKKTGVHINYQSIGSGGGIKQYTEGTVDFGASDGPMNADQMNAVQGKVIHIPTVMGADVLTYNLPSLGTTSL